MAKKKKSTQQAKKNNRKKDTQEKTFPLEEKNTPIIPLEKNETSVLNNKEEKSLAEDKENINEDKINTPKKNTQLYWLLGALVVLVMLFFVCYYLFRGINTIEYNGLTFTKEKYGEIPVFHNYYYITPELKYNLYIRNDPRKNTIPLTGYAVDKGIEFFQGNPIYISIDPEGLVGCEYSSVGISNLASFLVENQFKIKGASTDKEQAELNNVAYATCQYHPDGPVIILKGGNQTQIIYETTGCFIIEIANCEVLPAIEKFQVQMILDARARKASKQLL